ncbi:hypothetical protein [Peribacillus simplex]|uniref:hypothetical protein n=1 Tax=Peribacillus simplex TaxID=1478 RepID=UPI0024C1FF09|nr:hypothetical protein [Peribacillus simplex]WHY99918.1 hypothetical protein QNH37_12555 [Peribacillus simplex]
MYIEKSAGIEIELKGGRAIIQVLGNAGSYLATFMQGTGARAIGISVAYVALYDPKGLDIDYLLDCSDSFSTVNNLLQTS